MHRLKSLIVEAHRRSLWQVLGIYVVGAWIGYQVVNELTSGLGLPDWVPGFAFVFFIIGLPIVLATAFVQEGLPAPRREPALVDLDRVADLTLRDDAAAAGGGDSDDRPPRGRHHLLFTWQRAALSGAVAFLLLGITAGGYMGMRNAGIGAIGSLVAKGAIAERERVLISEFSGPSADPDLAALVTQAFRVDFAQSPVVTVVDAGYVRSALVRMQREPASPLDVDLARDVAVRDGIKAIVTGEVHRAAGGYVLTASLIGVADDVVLASFRETAADSTQVLQAVDRLSKNLRKRIGESMRTIRANQPLEAVTTPSLEALRKYTQGARAMDTERDFATAIRLLKEAIAIDSTFGMAWRKLAVAYSNNGDGYNMFAPAATRAYMLRDRMTAYERDAAAAYYHTSVTLDYPAAVASYRSMLEVHPDDRIALNNIAVVYHRMGEHAMAAESYAAALAADSTPQSAYGNLANELTELGRPDDAERVLDAYERRFGVTDASLNRRFHIAGLRRDYDAALAIAARMSEIRTGAASNRAAPLFMRMSVADVRGRLEEAARLEREALAVDLALSDRYWRGQADLSNAFRMLWLRNDPERAVKLLDATLSRYPLEQVTPMNRPYRPIAALYARAGHIARARHFYDEHVRTLPEERRDAEAVALQWQQYQLAVGEKRHEEALSTLRALRTSEKCLVCMHPPFADVFEALQQPDSAIYHWEQFIEKPTAYRIQEDAALAVALERLAELYYERGDNAQAAQYAARFVDLWKNADADLQPRVRAKQDLLRRLTAEGARR